MHSPIAGGDASIPNLKTNTCSSNSIADSPTLRRYGFSRYNEKWLLPGDSPLFKIKEPMTVATPETTFLGL